jgi:hypothetical protein
MGDDRMSERPRLDLDKRAAYLRHSLRLSRPATDAGAPLFSPADLERTRLVLNALRQRDPSVWSGDKAIQQKVANRLGWLTSPELMATSIDRLTEFADGVKRDGFTDVVLLGMGGSSLAPEVLRAIIGSAPGFPTLHVLDSTDPAAVRAVSAPVERTLFILASKSGSTIEPNSLAAHFQRLLEDSAIVLAPGDSGTSSSTPLTSAGATRPSPTSDSFPLRSWDRMSPHLWGGALPCSKRQTNPT